MHINEIIKTKGNNLKKEDLSNVRFYGIDIIQYALLGLSLKAEDNLNYKDIIYTNLTDVLLPKDSNIFQKIQHKSLEYVYLPNQDYSKYNFNNVVLRNCIFTANSKIPTNSMFFQMIKDKDISNSMLPSGDYSKYNFNNVLIKGLQLNKDSILPNTSDFPQKLKEKNICKLTLYNGNYEKWNLKDVNAEYVFWGNNIILPKDKLAFRKLKNSSIKGCTFVNKDLSIYDFKDVNIENCTFIKCKLPNYDWLLNIAKKSLEGCVFVDCNLENYDFSGVYIGKAKFLGASKLPNDLNVFQKIYNKDLENTVLPYGDYSKYKFVDVKMAYCKIPYNSKLPNDYDMFSKLKSNDYMALTSNVIKKIHLYDLSGLTINLTKYGKHLTDAQKSIIYQKNKVKITNKEIIL